MNHRAVPVPIARGVVLPVLLSAAAGVTVRAQEHLDLHVSFTDVSGAPVLDVQADEIAMVENGIRGTVVHLEQVNRDFDVTLLIDNGIGMGPALADIRSAARSFASGLPRGARLSVLTIAPQPRWLVRPTDDSSRVLTAINRLTPDDSLGRFVDALVEAGGRLDSGSDRIPVIVAVGSTAPDGSSSLEQHFRQLARRVVEHSAIVHVAILSTRATINGRVPVASQLQPTVGLELARLTGGRYEPIAVSSRLGTLLPELAAQIRDDSRRYHLRVRRPDGAKGDVGQVGLAISRPGVTIRSTLVHSTR